MKTKSSISLQYHLSNCPGWEGSYIHSGRGATVKDINGRLETILFKYKAGPLAWLFRDPNDPDYDPTAPLTVDEILNGVFLNLSR